MSPLSAEIFVPSVSDSVLGQLASAPGDPVPSVSDSALAEVEIPSASVDLVPSVPDSVLAHVDMPSSLDAPVLDRTNPDENGDHDDMGDSVPLESQQLATPWKHVSHKKGQQKNLAWNATASHSVAPVRKATRPNPPGAKPSRGKDSPE